MGFMEYENYDDTGHQIHETFANNEDSTFDVVDYGPRQHSGSLFNEIESNLGDSLFDFNIEKLHIRNTLHPADRKLMKKAFNCLVISYHESVRDSVLDSLSSMYNRKHYINLAMKSFILPTRNRRLRRLLNDAETYSLREFLYRWRLYILTVNEVKANEVKAKLFYESSLSSKCFKGFKFLIKQNNMKIYKLSRVVAIIEKIIIYNVLDPWNQMAKNQKRLELCQADIIHSHNRCVKQMAFNGMYKLYNYRVGVYILSDFTFYYLKKLAFRQLYQFCRQLFQKQVYLDKKIKLVWVEKFFEHWRFLTLYRNSTNYYNYKLKLKSFNILKWHKNKKLLYKNKYEMVKREVDKHQLESVLREMVNLYTNRKNRRELILRMTNVVDLYLKKKFYQILYENNKMIEFEEQNNLKAQNFNKRRLFNKGYLVLYDYKEYRRNKKSKLILASESYKRYLLSLVFEHLMRFYLENEKRNKEMIMEFRNDSNYRFKKLYFNTYRNTVNKIIRLKNNYETIHRNYNTYLVNSVLKRLENIVKVNYRRKISLISFIILNSNKDEINEYMDEDNEYNMDKDNNEKEEIMNDTQSDNIEKYTKERYIDDVAFQRNLKLVNNSKINVKLLLACTKPVKSESLSFLLHLLSLKSRFNEVYYSYYSNNEDELLNKLLKVMNVDLINHIKSKYCLLLHETRLMYISQNKPYGAAIEEYYEKLPNEIVYLLQYLILDNLFKLSSLLNNDNNNNKENKDKLKEYKRIENKDNNRDDKRKEEYKEYNIKDKETQYKEKRYRKDEYQEEEYYRQKEQEVEKQEYYIQKSQPESSQYYTEQLGQPGQVQSNTLLKLPLWRLVNLKFMVGKKRKMLDYWRNKTKNKIKKREMDTEYYESFEEMNKMFTKIRFFEEWAKLSGEMCERRKRILDEKYNKFYDKISMLVSNRKALGYVYMHLNYLNSSYKGKEVEENVRGWFTNFLMNNPEFNYSSLVFNYLKMKKILVTWRNFSVWYYNIKRDAYDFNRINRLVKSFKIWFTSTVYQNNERDKLGETIKNTSDSILKYITFIEWFKVSKLYKMLDKRNYEKNLMMKILNNWKEQTDRIQLERIQYGRINNSWNNSILNTYFTKWYNVYNYTLKDREMNEMAENFYYKNTLNKYIDKWESMVKKKVYLKECVESIEKSSLDNIKRYYFDMLYKYWKLNNWHKEMLIKNVFKSLKLLTFVSKLNKVIESRHLKQTKESVREFYNLIKENYRFYLECEKIMKNKKTFYSILYRLSNINNDRILQGLRILNTNAYYKTRYKLIRGKNNWLLLYEYFTRWKEVSNYNHYWVNRIEKVYTYLQQMSNYKEVYKDEKEKKLWNIDKRFSNISSNFVNNIGNIGIFSSSFSDIEIDNRDNNKKENEEKRYRKDEYQEEDHEENKLYQLKLIRTKYLLRLYPKILRYWKERCRVIDVPEEVIQDIKQFSFMNMVVETLRILHTNRLAVNCRKMMVNTAGEISYKRDLKLKSNVFKYLRSLVPTMSQYPLLIMEEYEELLLDDENKVESPVDEAVVEAVVENVVPDNIEDENIDKEIDDKDNGEKEQREEDRESKEENEDINQELENKKIKEELRNDNILELGREGVTRSRLEKYYDNKYEQECINASNTTTDTMSVSETLSHRFYSIDPLIVEDGNVDKSKSSHVKVYNLDDSDQEVDSSRLEQPIVYSISLEDSLVVDKYVELNQEGDNNDIIKLYNKED